MTYTRQSQRQTRENRRINNATIAAALCHLGPGYDTEEARAYAMDVWEEQAAFNYREGQRYLVQDDRLVPEEGAIAHCPEMGHFPWIHLAVFGTQDGHASVLPVFTETEERPNEECVSFDGLTFIRWIDGRSVGPINGNFDEEF